MKIKEVITSVEVSITTDEEEYNEYVRYSADNWYVWMGESLEPQYSCDEQEKAYQEYLREKDIDRIRQEFPSGSTWYHINNKGNVVEHIVHSGMSPQGINELSKIYRLYPSWKEANEALINFNKMFNTFKETK